MERISNMKAGQTIFCQLLNPLKSWNAFGVRCLKQQIRSSPAINFVWVFLKSGHIWYAIFSHSWNANKWETPSYNPEVTHKVFAHSNFFLGKVESLHAQNDNEEIHSSFGMSVLREFLLSTRQGCQQGAYKIRAWIYNQNTHLGQTLNFGPQFSIF